jgi:hypothetical protein
MEPCRRCGEAFIPKRLAQAYCSRRCRVADAVARHRSDYTKATVPEKRLQAPEHAPVASDKPSEPYVNPHGPTPGAMQGDSYPLEILLGRLSEAAGMSRP